MTNLSNVFKSEISRLAKKEIKAQLMPTKKLVSKQRRDIAALKREIRSLERQLEKARGIKPSEEGEEASDDVLDNKRFSARSVRAQRKRLKLSAQDFAQLLGVSAQTVYHWESGKSRPRRSQMESLVAVREMGKREADQKLAEMQASQ